MTPAPSSEDSRQSLRILFPCVGRRVELLDAFRRAADRLGVDLELHGVDVNLTAPAMHVVDVPHLVPRIREPGYLPALLQICKESRIDAVIPLIDSDLQILADNSAKFTEAGVHLILSEPHVIETCSDKLLTYNALCDAGIDTPQSWSAEGILAEANPPFPLFIKPIAGSAGKGLYKVSNRRELEVIIERDSAVIVQEFIDGHEHTLDVYAGLDGKVRCVVPRKRLEVRTGEVSKGIVVKDAAVMNVGRRVVAALGDCQGVVTVQCMVTADGRICAIEINPRFGGGAPLSIAAGADFPAWIMGEMLGLEPPVEYEDYRDRIAMLRYDESVFVDATDLDHPTLLDVPGSGRRIRGQNS